MVALNFMPQFAAEVETGKKRQTIRENTLAYPGCDLQLYTGMRTKSCRKLKDVKCTSVQMIVVMENAVVPAGNAIISGQFLDTFAQSDGFKTYADMWAFFKGRSKDGKFMGFLIRW